jgi:cation diffusion facilitator family transporter
MSKGFEERKRAGYIEGAVSIIVNTLLFIAKYIVGAMFNSIAVIADSIHTLSDSLTSIVLIIGYHLASKPADREHPFGHGRFEVITGVVIGVLLGVIAYDFVFESVEKLLNRIPLVYSDLLIVVLAASTLAKALLSLWAYRLGKRHSSSPILADAWHHLSDTIATGVLSIAIYTGRSIWWLDGVLGVTVSTLIFYTAGRIIYDSSMELLGRAPSKVEQDDLIRVIRDACPEIEGVHHIHFHKYGDHVEVTLHVNLPGDITLSQAHDVANRIERVVREKLGYIVTVHVEPREQGDFDEE